MCRMTQEKLTSKYNLEELDPCPLCKVAIGYHTLSPSTTTSTTGTGGRDGAKSTLPVWKKDHHQVKPLLDRVEQILTADAVDKKYWPRCLVKVVTNVSDGAWVVKHIVDAKVEWKEARTLFANHFEVFTYAEKLIGEYERIKQQRNETAQRFADRFAQLIDELGYDSDNQLVIQHYMNSLLPRTLAELKQHISRAKLIKQDLGLNTLKEVMDTVLELERVQTIYSGIMSLSLDSPHSNSNNGGSSQGKSDTVKLCAYHPGTTSHTTAECKTRGQGTPFKSNDGTKVSSSPAQSWRSGSETQSWRSGNDIQANRVKKEQDKGMVCFVCKGVGHRANDPACPRYSSRDLRERDRSSSTTTVTSSSSGVRNGNAPSSNSTAPSGTSTSTITRRIQSIYSNNDDGNESDASDQADEADNEQTRIIGSIQSTYVTSSSIDRTICEQVCAPKKLEVMLMVKDMIFNTLIDTGADVSCIDEALVKELNLPILPSKYRSFTMANSGVSMPSTGSVVVDVVVLFPSYQRETITTQFKCEILPVHSSAADHHFIIGRDLILTIFPKGIPPEYISSLRPAPNVGVISSLASSCPTDVIDVSLQTSAISTSTSTELESEYASKREQLLADLAPLLTINAAITGFCNLPEAVMELRINPEMENKLYRRQYPIPQTMMAMVTDVINRWYKEGKICLAPPGCRYNNPITPVPKRDDNGNLTAVRPCLDVRALNNALVIGDNFPIPHIRSALEALAGNSIFSEFDLQEAYLQLPLHPDSRPLTAFTWNNQQYMFVGCPFGLSPLTSHFQRLMSRIFSDMPFCYAYVDNLPFASKDWSTHLHYAMLIVNRLTTVNLKIKPKFSTIGHSQLKCLGHIISSKGIGIDPDKLQAVKDWPLPKTGTELQSFLGLCSFLRQHVRHFAELTGPLEAVKHDRIITYNDNLMESFNAIKQAILTSPVLATANYDRAFHLATDASQTGVGGVLFQPSTKDEFITPINIVAICSRKLQPHQQRWSAYKKELYGIVYSLRKFHAYIWGRHDLVVHTDHKPLIHMFSSSQLSPALQQWLDVILDYSFDIRHRDGIMNVMPDQLSRMYGAAYSHSPIWGVNGIFPSSPLPSESMPSVLMGEREAPASSANTDNKSAVLGAINHAHYSNDDAIAHRQEDDDRLLVELEKRGKRCPLDDEEKQQLIRDAHSFGHFGREAIFKDLWYKDWWWPSIRSDINNMLSNCDACTRYVVVQRGYHPASSITATGPGDHFQIDTSVHLPESPDGYRALLVCIDVFTGFVLLRPLRDTTAETVARKLWKIFATVGLPKILQSDNGGEYANDVLNALIKLTGIDHRFISAYNPRADGKVERSIGTVMMIIKKLLHGTNKYWPLFVSFAQLAFNNKVSSLTGSTPFSLMFGRTLNDIIDYTQLEAPTPISLEDWKLHQEKIISLIYPAISEKIKSGKDKMVKTLNKNRKQLLSAYSFPTGATVMIVDVNRQNKWEPKYVGPYIHCAQISWRSLCT